MSLGAFSYTLWVSSAFRRIAELTLLAVPFHFLQRASSGPNLGIMHGVVACLSKCGASRQGLCRAC